MKYERLTYRRIRDGHAYAKAEYGDFEVVDRLAELEDKIEQGTLIFKENEDENSRKE